MAKGIKRSMWSNLMTIFRLLDPKRSIYGSYFQESSKKKITSLNHTIYFKHRQPIYMKDEIGMGQTDPFTPIIYILIPWETKCLY